MQISYPISHDAKIKQNLLSVDENSLEKIYQYLDAKDLIALSQTCRQFLSLGQMAVHIIEALDIVDPHLQEKAEENVAAAFARVLNDQNNEYPRAQALNQYYCTIFQKKDYSQKHLINSYCAHLFDEYMNSDSYLSCFVLYQNTKQMKVYEYKILLKQKTALHQIIKKIHQSILSDKKEESSRYAVCTLNNNRSFSITKKENSFQYFSFPQKNDEKIELPSEMEVYAIARCPHKGYEHQKHEKSIKSAFLKKETSWVQKYNPSLPPAGPFGLFRKALEKNKWSFLAVDIKEEFPKLKKISTHSHIYNSAQALFVHINHGKAHFQEKFDQDKS